MVSDSLWRQGLRSFNRDLKAWLPLGVIFFFVIGVFNVALTSFLPPFQEKLDALRNQNDPKIIGEFMISQAPTIVSFSLAMALAMFIQRYIFLCFFLKREMPNEMPSATARDFFCFVSKGIQLGFIIVVPSVALGSGALIALCYAEMSLNFSLVVALFIAVSFAIWLMQRLSMVMPLAAGKKAKPIKTSWCLTEGKVWRLIGNVLMLGLIMLGAYLLLALLIVVLSIGISLLSQSLVPALSLWVPIFFKCVVSSALQVLISGVAIAYLSAVCRILYEEKRQADPNFIIATRN